MNAPMQQQRRVVRPNTRSLTDDFELQESVGSGTYGKVISAFRLSDRQKCSIKQSQIKNEDRSITPSIFRELVLLSEINYPHIIHPSSKDVYCDFDKYIISFAYEYGAVDVRKLITYYNYTKKSTPINPVVTKSILFQLLLALDYLHKRSIAHCDITPSNLLIMPATATYPGILKLIDFGLSRVIESTSQNRNFGVVTVWYRAPELLLGDPQYTQKIDLWAAGCIFGELLSGQVLFCPKSKMTEEDATRFNPQQLGQIISVLGPINPDTDCSPHCSHRDKLNPSHMTGAKNDQNLRMKVPYATAQAFDLLTKMLEYNPNKRISARDALRHPYFNEQPICVMNISSQIPPEDWNVLKDIGARATEQ